MLDQFIITGLSGVLIIGYVIGLGLVAKVYKGRDEGWKISLRKNLKGVLNWFLFVFSILFTLMIIVGVFLG